MSGEQSKNGLFFAQRLLGDGNGCAIGWEAIENWTSGDGPIWVHLDRTHPNTEDWLRHRSGLTKATIDALLANETRPRVFQGKRGTVAILRGVNLNPGENVEDMIDLRIWSEGERLITLRKTRLQTVRDVSDLLSGHGDGPESISALFGTLITTLSQKMLPTIEGFEPRLDQIEQSFDVSKAGDIRARLVAVRNEAVALRRYLAPQRIALNELVNDPPSWADENWHPAMREAADTLAYYIEELDETRDHAVVIKDDIASQMAETTNRTLYALAVISGVFLPLAFLTGLLGINIGGMPGVEDNRAFWIFCALLVVFGAGEIALFKKLKWI